MRLYILIQMQSTAQQRKHFREEDTWVFADYRHVFTKCQCLLNDSHIFYYYQIQWLIAVTHSLINAKVSHVKTNGHKDAQTESTV